MSLEFIEYQHQSVLAYSEERLDFMKALSELPIQFKTMAANVKEFVMAKLATEPFNAHVIRSTPQFDQFIRDMKYTSAVGVRFACPPGLKVTIPEYLKVLDGVQSTLIDHLFDGALEPSLRWVAGVLSDPNKLSSVRSFTKDAGVSITESVIDVNRKHIADCFVKGSSMDTMTYHKLYRSNREFAESIHHVNTLNERLAKISHKKILEVTDAIAEGVNTMIMEIDNGNPQYQLSTGMLNDLSNTMHLLAQLVSFYSSYSFLVMSVTKATEDNVQIAANVMK